MSLTLCNLAELAITNERYALADQLCEASGLGLTSGKYYTPEASDIRYKVFLAYANKTCKEGRSWHCNEPLAMHLLKECRFFYFPAEGMDEVAKTLLIAELESVNDQVDECIFGFMRDLGCPIISFAPRYAEQIKELVKFLKETDLVFSK